MKWCARCGHSSDDHRMDSTKNYDPTDSSTPFRCLGPDLNGCDEKCPDFVNPAE